MQTSPPPNETFCYRLHRLGESIRPEALFIHQGQIVLVESGTVYQLIPQSDDSFRVSKQVKTAEWIAEAINVDRQDCHWMYFSPANYLEKFFHNKAIYYQHCQSSNETHLNNYIIFDASGVTTVAANQVKLEMSVMEADPETTTYRILDEKNRHGYYLMPSLNQRYYFVPVSSISTNNFEAAKIVPKFGKRLETFGKSDTIVARKADEESNGHTIFHSLPMGFIRQETIYAFDFAGRYMVTLPNKFHKQVGSIQFTKKTFAKFVHCNVTTKTVPRTGGTSAALLTTSRVIGLVVFFLFLIFIPLVVYWVLCVRRPSQITSSSASLSKAPPPTTTTNNNNNTKDTTTRITSVEKIRMLTKPTKNGWY